MKKISQSYQKNTYSLFQVFLMLFFSSTMVLAQNSWSDPMTWANLGLTTPIVGDDVNIPSGAHILLDVSPPELGALTIAGTLSFDNQDLNLTAERILVTGTLEIGTEIVPFTNQATLTLNGTDMNVSTADRGILVRGGSLELHGNPPAIPWSKINANAPAGSTGLTMMEDVNWNIGDQVVIAPTDYYSTPPTHLAGLTASNGNQLTIDVGLNGYRWGQLQYATNSGMSLSSAGSVTPPALMGFTPIILDERAPVGNLTRNIIIQSPDDVLWQNNCFGVHITITRMGSGDVKGIAHINGVEIRRGGQNGNMGRYPFHWHMSSYEDCANPAGTCQILGDATGQYLTNSAINVSCQRGVVIHGTNGVNVSNNVIYDVRGHGVMTEDGAERRNIINGNLVLHVRNGGLLAHESSNRGSSGFWISTPDNYLEDNVAADCQTNGFWLAFAMNPWRLCRYVPLTPAAMTFGVFNNNTAHSNRLEGVLLDFVEVENEAVQERQYFSTSDGIYPSAPYSNVQRFEMTRFKTWKNGSRGLWDRTAAIDLYEIVSADNCGRFFAGSGAVGVIERSLVVGTSLNHFLNGVVRPNFTGETTPAAFATYHSGFSIRDNVIVNFPESAGEMSGAFATNDYYLRPVERGHIRSPNNLLVESHPGVKLLAPFNFFTLASAFWDVHGIWGGTPGDYLVYDIPFLTHGQTPVSVAPGAVSGGVLVEGPFFGFYEFVVNVANDRNNDLMAIDVNRLDNSFNSVATWSVAEAFPGQGLAHMRDFAAHPDSYYSLAFPDISPVTDVGMTIENMPTANETLILAVEFSGIHALGQVYTSSRYTYFEPGHTNAGTYAHKHLYQPVGSRQAVIDSAGETYWQDTDNDLVWIKIVGGIDQESWNPADFTAEDDELLYWEFYLRITDIPNPNALPVEINHFSAKLQNNGQVKLKWITAVEINNSGFEIQRSIDGKHFEKIAFVKGQGDGNQEKEYAYEDDVAIKGTNNYYRLRQINWDGSSSLSSIEVVQISNETEIKILSNPVKSEVSIYIYNDFDDTALIKIFNTTGQLKLTKKVKLLQGENVLTLATFDLKNGMYTIMIEKKNYSQILKFVKI